MPALDKAKIGYSEQDTADKLILPFLASAHKFPSPDSLDYQAQHTLIVEPGKSGRYDGLFLSGGYPYAVLEAKKYSNDLTEEDEHQARDYATSPFFDKPVPFIIVSNGREHRFLKITATIDPADGKLTYNKIPATNWPRITSEQPGEVRRLLGAKELLDSRIIDREGAPNIFVEKQFASEFIVKRTHDTAPPYLVAIGIKSLSIARHALVIGQQCATQTLEAYWWQPFLGNRDNPNPCFLFM